MWCDDCATSLNRGSCVCVNNVNAMVIDQILTKCGILLVLCISFDVSKVWSINAFVVLNQQERKNLEECFIRRAITMKYEEAIT